MQALFLTFIFAFLTTLHIHSNAMDDAIPKPTVLEPNLSISHQPYTAQQHFQDIKEFFDSIKYQNPKNFNELRDNRTIDCLILFLKEKLDTQESSFIEHAIPFIVITTFKTKFEFSKYTKVQFQNGIKPLLEKRERALKDTDNNKEN